MTLLQRIKTITGLGAEYDDVLNELISLATDAVLAYCDLTLLPTELEFIVVEMVIARYNRLGTEGFKSEQVDVVKQEFFQDSIASYRPFLDSYNLNNKSSVRFI